MPKVSVQLWSVKETLKQDFEGTLTELSKMNFDGVEFFGYFGPYQDKPAELKSFLNQLGLVASSGHVKFKELDKQNFDKTVSFYKALGVNYLIVPWDKRAWHPEKVKLMVKQLNKLSAKLKSYGMRIGFHNHDREFNRYNNGTYWDYIARNTSDDVILQLDVGWVTHANKNAVDYIKKYPGRTVTTHYKSMAPKGVEGVLPIIGQDATDWLAISRTNMAVGGTEWFVVEQEEYPNGLTPLKAVDASKKGLMQILSQL